MSPNWQFGRLQMFGYSVLVVDCPWDFENYSEAGTKKGADPHYKVMSIEQIKALRIGDLASGDCLLLFWCPEWLEPRIRQEIIEAWGFVYKTTIIWRKTTRNGKVRMGTGYRARTMHEPVLICTMGNPKHTAFPSLFDGIARQHSRKPEEFYKMVDRCCRKVFKADLFSRQNRKGWDTWGLEAGKYDNEVVGERPKAAIVDAVEFREEELGGLFATIGADNGTPRRVEEQA